MAKFRLTDGEQTLFEETVKHAIDGRLHYARLVLTDQRVVLLGRTKDGGDRVAHYIRIDLLRLRLRNWLFPPNVVLHRIVRDELATAVASSATELNVRSKGEGYGMTWFDVVTSDANRWCERLRSWAESPVAARVDRA
jgi:hypothetical protein